jgi:ATP-dependent 26S proteasome regulatory subunit
VILLRSRGNPFLLPPILDMLYFYDVASETDLQGTAQEIKMQARMIDNEIKMMRQEALRLGHEREQMSEKIADNATKIKQNKVLPYLVSKVVEVSWIVLLQLNAHDRSLMSTRKFRKGRRITNKMPRRANVPSSRHRPDK